MQSVHGWRVESDEAVSETAQRLLRWMHDISPSGGDLDDIGRRIACGLRDLTDAQSVLLLARPSRRDELWPLVWVQDEGKTLFASDTGAWAGDERPRLFAGRGLLSLPSETQWHVDAPEEARILVSDVIEVVRARRQVSAGAESEAALPSVPPSLMVPLHLTWFDGDDTEEDEHHFNSNSFNSNAATRLRGLALLWMESEDGLLASERQTMLQAVAQQAAAWLEHATREERMSRSYRELAEVCAAAIDGRDRQRSGHSEAVAHYCRLIGWSLGLREAEIERIDFAGLLHDIGKVAVPDAVLQKRAPLELDEMESVRASTQVGAAWLEGVEGLEEVASIVRHQAESFDGSGYPDGLRGEEIPLGSRVLAVAVRFAAMTNARADRAALSVVGGAVEAIAAESGRALDPRVVQAFLLAMGRRIEE